MSKKENSLASKREMKKRGEHGFKLNETNVGEIKWLLQNTKLKKKEIAKIYNVVASQIYKISND